MLTLIQGGLYADTGREMRTRIEARIRAKRPSLLLVPEQQTVTAESEYADRLPADAPLSFEVMNFTRLPNRIFREIGGLSDSYSDETVRALFMWRTLTELSPLLSPSFGKVSEGTVEKALSALRELRAMCLDAPMLSEASEAVEQAHPRLSEKLSDLAKVLALFHSLHDGKYRDSGDDMLVMAKKLFEHPDILRGTEIFIDGFTSFTEEQYRVIEALLSVTDVTLTLRIPKTAEDGFEFTEPRCVRERMTALAARIGTEVHVKKVDGAEGVAPILQNALPLLWRSEGEIDNSYLQNADSSLRIFKAPTPYDMASFVAQDIRRRVMEEGCRYRDFVVVYSKASAAEGLLEVALGGAGIPSTLHAAREVCSFEAIKLIDAAYATVSGGFRRSDLLAYAKCGLSGIPADLLCELELYLERWQLEGRALLSDTPFGMNPFGYGAEATAQSAALLSRINEAREMLLPPLRSFAEDTGAATTVTDHARATVRLLTELSLEENLRLRAERLRSFGEHEEADENERLFRVICDSLDTLVEVMGDFPADARVFRSLLGIVFRSVRMGHIPALYDAVSAGTADLIRPADAKHVYLLGVNAGEFPMNPSDSGALTLSDRECLHALGYPTEASREVQSARELFSFSRAFSMGRESVTLLYTERNSSYTATPPADVIARIAQISSKKILPVSTETLRASERYYTAEAAMAGYDRMTAQERATVTEALKGTGYTQTLGVLSRRLTNDTLTLSRETASSLYNGVMSLTQSRLDAYVQCPFKHFCTYTLRLSEQRRAKLDNLNIGTFLHAILERFLSDIKREGIEHGTLTAEERKRRIAEIAKEESERLLRCGGKRERREALQIGRLTKAAEIMAESLCREFSHRDGFKPAFFELRIGGEEGPRAPHIPTEDGDVCIYGTIDRVDALRAGDDVYLRVVDYKTGRKSFSPSDLEKGENMQMFLYLRSLTEAPTEAFKASLGVGEGGRILPAGAIYMNALTEDKNQPAPPVEDRRIEMADTRSGMLLDDPAVLAGIHPDFLPIKFNKDGSVSQTSKKNLYTPEGWDALMENLSTVVSDIAQRMRHGDIRVERKNTKSKTSPCEYCPYKAVCRSAH